MVAILLGADNGFFYAGQIMHFSSPFTVFLIYHKQYYLKLLGIYNNLSYKIYWKYIKRNVMLDCLISEKV